VEATGRWDTPEPWPPQETVGLPWTRDELAAALTALRRIYPPDITKKIFRAQPGIAQLLSDISLTRQSPLLYFGLDAVVASPWHYPELVKKLRSDQQFPGARFEVSVMASLTRGGVTWAYEPLKDVGVVNPDFEVSTGEYYLLMDAKAARIGALRRKEEAWYWRLMFGDAPAPPDLLLAELEVDHAVTQLEETRRTALAEAVRSAAKRLHSAGSYPASECVDGLIRVTVDSTPRSSLNPVYDLESEARRVVRGLVHEGAGQIPADREGALLVDLGGFGQGDLGKTFEEVRRWMREEGRLEQRVGYVLLTCLGFHKHKVLRYVLPIGRRRLPYEVIQLTNALVQGFNWHASLLEGCTGDDLPLLNLDGDWPGMEE